MNRPTLELFPTAPPINIFSTTLDIDAVVDTQTTSMGGVETVKPGWVCGVDIESTCSCEPNVYPTEPGCDAAESPIAANWGDGLIVDPFNPTGYCRTERAVGCCKYRFNPVKVYETFVDATGCMRSEDLQRRATEPLAAFSNRVVSDLLVGSTNGNPGLAAHATGIGGGATLSAAVAFGILHANAPAAGVVVVPWQAIAILINENLIHPVLADGRLAGYVDAWGYPVVTDPGLTGLVGPPAVPWDGQTPIDPATDFQPAGPGTGWMYITPPIWTGQSNPVSTVTRRDVASDTHVKGNYTIGSADAQVIAVFNPCDIYAAKIEINKAVNCG